MQASAIGPGDCAPESLKPRLSAEPGLKKERRHLRNCRKLQGGGTFRVWDSGFNSIIRFIASKVVVAITVS